VTTFDSALTFVATFSAPRFVVTRSNVSVTLPSACTTSLNWSSEGSEPPASWISTLTVLLAADGCAVTR
jgi:hypothetical protein